MQDTQHTKTPSIQDTQHERQLVYKKLRIQDTQHPKTLSIKDAQHKGP